MSADDPAPDAVSDAPDDSASGLRARLSRRGGSGPVVQDFSPIVESVDWRLSRAAWSSRGLESFVSGDVPYAVMNDGRLSDMAAAFFVRRARALDPSGTEALWVLELGAGSGLFARLFLTALRRRNAGVYARTRYVVTDGSPAMIANLGDSGVLDEHRERVLVRNVLVPDLGALPGDLGREHGAFRGFHLALGNYLLDSLPFTIVRVEPDGLRELRVLTTLDPAVDVEARFGVSAAEIAELAEMLATSGDGVRPELLGLPAAFVVEGRYVPVERADVPYGDAVPRPLANAGGVVPHSYGSLACIDAVLEVLAPGGVFIANDYGYATEAEPVYRYQHFGPTVASGVNFAQLDAVYGARDRVTIAAPENWNASLHSRLVGRDADSAVPDFLSTFDGKRFVRVDAALDEALKLLDDRDLEGARVKLLEAYDLHPYCWRVHERITSFYVHAAKDAAEGMAFGRAGLTLNPLSTRLWNLVGDALFYSDEPEAAAEAFRRTIEINPREVRGRLNLAYCQIAQQDFRGALRSLADALALDEGGDHRDELLGKQREALERMDDRHREDLCRRIDRFRCFHGPRSPADDHGAAT